MKTTYFSQPVRTLTAGAFCLVVLSAMAVIHAWPLWTGRDVVMAATIAGGSNRSASGEYLRLHIKAERIRTGPTPDEPKMEWADVRAIEPWVPAGDQRRRLRGRTVYVQLEPDARGDYAPVSVSLVRVPGAVNLRGICMRTSGDGLVVRYGLDAFFLQQDRAAQVQSAGTASRRIQVRVAIADSGRARIRDLLVDGARIE